MESNALHTKKQIVEAAIALLLDDEGPVTWEFLSAASGLTEEEIRSHFDKPSEVADTFYTLCIEEYKTVRNAIDGYDSFSLEEQVSTFVYMMFDFLQEQRLYVKHSFHKMMLGGVGSEFRTELGSLFKEFLDNDDVPMANRVITGFGPLHTFIAYQYLLLIKFWLSDESDDQQKSLALAEKLIAFFVDVASFRGIDRGVELFKYMVNADVLGLGHLPFVGSFFKKDKTEESA